MSKWIALWLLVLGVSVRASELKYFAGWECQGVDEALLADTNVPDNFVYNTVDTPWEGVEDWYIYLDDASTKYYFTSPSWSCSSTTEQIQGVYVRFVNDITPETEIAFFAGAASKVANHIELVLETNGFLYLYDSDGNSIDGAYVQSPFVLDTWYLVELRWKRHSTTGYAVVRIDGVEVINVTDQDFSTGYDYCEIRIEGMQGMAGTPTPVLVNSMYALYGTDGDEDFLGPYQVLGPYTTDHATATSDAGDNLSTGYWEDLADIPLSTSNSAIMGGEDWGVKRTNGVTGAGPFNDPRINKNGIVGACWVADPRANESQMIYGRHQNSTYTHTMSSMVLDSRSGNDVVCVSSSSGYCPDSTGYFLLGLSAAVGLGSSWDDCFAHLIQRAPSGKKRLVNASLLPMTLVGGEP